MGGPRRPGASTRRLCAAGLLALLPGAALALDQSKLPPGNDHEQAHALSEGDAVAVGVVEAPESGTGNENIDTTKYHFAGRLVERRDFSGAVPPLSSLPAAASGPGSAHSTLVGDIALSDDATYTGVASKGDFYGAWTSFYNEDRAAFDIYERAEGVYIFNASWGAGGNTNGTTQYTLFFDWFASHRDALIVKSAGNTSGQITIPGDAFNILTVGGLDSSGGAYQRRRASSSYLLSSDDGTAPDERGKPEIVAPGQNIGNGFINQTGTSHAAPHVAGIAALLVEAGLSLPGPALRSHLAHKAIILNSARKRRINAPDPGNALAFDNLSTDTQPSDGDYLQADGTLRPGTSGSAPRTDAWTPSSWEYADGIFLTTRPLDDELGAGVADARRALLQHAGGEQAPGDVGAIGWNRDCLASGSHSYTLSGAVPEGGFLTATLTWDRAVDSTDGDEIVNASESYLHHAGGLGFLPDFDLEIRRLGGMGTTLVASSLGAGGTLTGQNVEHLHVPLPSAGSYQVRVVLNGTSPDCIDYALAWWGPQTIPVPAGSSWTRAALGLLMMTGAGLALARRRGPRA
jgi:hypothetical protein